jgi:hypothetical protein
MTVTKMLKIVEECAEQEAKQKQAEVPAMKIAEMLAEQKADQGQVEVPL